MDKPMHGDATLLKEKIIKTDILLKKYQENLSKLKKTTELCKYLKKKYEETKQTLEITQLENDRAKFKLENIQSKHLEVEVENTRLSSDLTKLEEQYQKYNLDTQSTIQNLQHELRLLQELKQSTTDTGTKIKSLEGKFKKLQAAEQNYKVEIDRLNAQQNKIYEKHEAEKSTLLKQIEKLKLQVTPKHGNCHLKSDSLNDNINLKDHSNEEIEAITDLENIIKNESEINSERSNGSVANALNDLELANSENVSLKQQLNIKNREIAALKIKKAVKSVSAQTEKVFNNLKDACHTENCNDYLPDLSSESDLEVIVQDDLHVNQPKPNQNSIAFLKHTNIIKEQSYGIFSKASASVSSHCKGSYETQNNLSPQKLAIYDMSTQTECFDSGGLDKLNDLKSANAENTKLKQQLNMKNREIAALKIKKSAESVCVQTEQIISNNKATCYTENPRCYFPDSNSESDFEDIVYDVKQKSLGTISPNCEKLDETQNVSTTKSAIYDVSTQTEHFYTGVFSRKPEMAVISTQTIMKTISFSTQTEHKYVSLSTQTDRDDTITKGIDISIQNYTIASDEESISDILTEMTNIPRLLSPISDILDKKIPDAKQAIGRRNINFIRRNIRRRTIWANRSYSPKYVPWKRRMIIKNMRSDITQDSVTTALQILKRAKINFTISNESILPQGIPTHPRYYCNRLVMPQNQPVGTRNTKQNYAEKLSCCFSSCLANSTHMMLSDRGDCTELLGFFNEERESTTRTNVNIASHAMQRNNNYEPKADFVDETAKIVISKLKEEFSLIPKKRRRRNLSSSDSEISEFGKDGLSTKRSIKKTKWLQGIKHRRHIQTEETTSGFESSSTPLSQYSTINSQKFGFKVNENHLQKSLEDLFSYSHDNKTPLSPLSDITTSNQISESNVSLGDCESQEINQYNVHSVSHINEEMIDCNIKTVLNDGIPEMTKQKCDFKLPQVKHEGGEINSKDAGTSIEKIKPKKKRQPMGKLKSKTLRQFKEKRLMFQTEPPRVISVCNGIIENKSHNENLVQNKYISKATIDKTGNRKSPNGKNNGLFEPLYIESSRKTNEGTKGKHTNPDVNDIYLISKSTHHSDATEVKHMSGDEKAMSTVDTPSLQIPSREFERKNKIISIESFKVDPIKDKIGMQCVDKEYDKKIGDSSNIVDTNIKTKRKINMCDTESNSANDIIISSSDNLSDQKISRSSIEICNLMTNPHFTRSRSNTSLICDEQFKHGKIIDSLQDLVISASVKGCVEPQSKLLKAIELKKVENQKMSNSDNHENKKSSNMCYNSYELVDGGIHPDTDFSLKDLDTKASGMTPKCERRQSHRLMRKSEMSNSDKKSGMIMETDRESLTVTANSTETSIEHCGTYSSEKDELRANLDMNQELNITGDKIDLPVKSTKSVDLPQVSFCDFIDTPASPEYLPEPEDCNIKIIPLDPIESISTSECYIKKENFVNEEIQQEEDKSTIDKKVSQDKIPVRKRLRKYSINNKGTKKKINVLQNVVINPSNITSVNENGDVDNVGPCDVLSKIMGEMDKNRGSFISKIKPVFSVGIKNPAIFNVATTNHRLDDKEWRRMILDVAELIYCDEEMLNFDLQPYEIQMMPQTYLKKLSLLEKANFLIKKLKATNENENIRDELILEFRKLSPKTVINIILYGLTKDKATTLGKYHPLLLLTKMQWLFIKLMIRLEQGKMKNIFELYLQAAENLLYRKCSLTKVVPVTRLYVAICKLHGNVNRVRKLCCEAFYYTADLAVVLLFTVLTSWIEIFPMQDNMKCYPVAAVMTQLIHLKNIKNRNFKLQPLKVLLNQHYGYPKERLDCDEFFEGLVQNYLRNPTRMLNFSIRLYCKYKNNDWLKKKINEIFKPLVYKIPVENEHFKATVIILLANICEHLKISSTDKYMVELKAWFSSLSEGDTPEVIQHSVEYALNKLSITRTVQKKGKKAKARRKVELSQQHGNC